MNTQRVKAKSGRHVGNATSIKNTAVENEDIHKAEGANDLETPESREALADKLERSRLVKEIVQALAHTDDLDRLRVISHLLKAGQAMGQTRS